MLQEELWISADIVYVFCDFICLVCVRMLMIVSLQKKSEQ